MNQIFLFVSGLMANKVWTAQVMDVKLVAVMSILLVGLVGTYVSYKGLNILFSRNYRKVK